MSFLSHALFSNKLSRRFFHFRNFDHTLHLNPKLQLRSLIAPSECLINISKYMSKTERVIFLKVAPVSMESTSTHTTPKARNLGTLLDCSAPPPAPRSEHHRLLVRISSPAFGTTTVLPFSMTPSILHLASRVSLLINKSHVTPQLKTFGRLPVTPRRKRHSL